MLIYIHGFNSSSASGKAQALLAWFAARGEPNAVACPDLPHRPAEAIALLETLIAASPTPAKLVGSSLGGFYATWLAEKHGLKAVHVNPCVACHAKLVDQVGREQRNWHSGETYTFTAEHLAALERLQLPAVSRPQDHLLLVEQADEILDYREAVEYFRGARQVVLEGGNHGFTRFNDYIQAIVDF